MYYQNKFILRDYRVLRLRLAVELLKFYVVYSIYES